MATTSSVYENGNLPKLTVLKYNISVVHRNTYLINNSRLNENEAESDVVALTELLAFIHSWRLPLLENVRVIYILSLATPREIRVLSWKPIYITLMGITGTRSGGVTIHTYKQLI